MCNVQINRDTKRVTITFKDLLDNKSTLKVVGISIEDAILLGTILDSSMDFLKGGD